MSPTPSELLQKKAEQIAADRARARVDKLFLANEVLGCHFVPDVHAELFEQFIPIDASKQLPFLHDIKSRLILFPRGHYKTTAVVVEIIQLILNYPDIRILVMRSTKQITQEWLNEIISHFTGEAENSRLRELFPEFCGNRKELRGTADHFTVPCRKRKQLREATVTTASATSNKTGSHFDAAFFDDLVTDRNAGNTAQVEKVTKAYYMCIPLIDPGGYFYVTGTRYAHGDLYEQILRTNTNKAWIASVKTCWKNDDASQGPRFTQREFSLRNGVKKVIGFTTEMLLGFMHSDPGMFSSQYLNRPAIEGTQTFSEALLSTALVDPEGEVALVQPVIMVDLSTGQGPRSDDAVIMVAKRDAQGNTYIVDGIGGHWTPTQIAEYTIAMTLKHRAVKVLTESSNAAILFRTVLERECRDKGVHVPFDILKGNNKADAKRDRIWNLHTYLQRGRLKFFSNLPCWDKTKKQFLNWTGDKHQHDDYPDTVALLVGSLSIGFAAPASTLSANRIIAAVEAQHDAMQVFARSEPENTNGWPDCGSDICC